LKTIAIILFTIIFGLLLHSQLSQAQPIIYKWTDEKGTTHYSEDPNAVPEKYKNKAQKKDIDEFPPLLPDKLKRPQSYSSEPSSNTTVEKTHRRRGECEIIGFSQYEVSSGRGQRSERGTMLYGGGYASYQGSGTYNEIRETCVNITIQNNDWETKEITEANVVANGRFRPKPFKMQVRPGETSEVSVCFGLKMPRISKLQLYNL